MAIGTYISIITLNVNGLNAPTKRHRLAEWIQKQTCRAHAKEYFLELLLPVSLSPRWSRATPPPTPCRSPSNTSNPLWDDWFWRTKKGGEFSFLEFSFWTFISGNISLGGIWIWWKPNRRSRRNLKLGTELSFLCQLSHLSMPEFPNIRKSQILAQRDSMIFQTPQVQLSGERNIHLCKKYGGWEKTCRWLGLP